MAVLAVEDLLAKVRQEFAEEGVNVPILFGWRTPAQQITTGPRITWVPGNSKTGDLGTLGPAKWPGRQPRPIATLDELFTLTVIGFDLGDPENEEKQYSRTRHLYDTLLRAIHHAAHGTYAIRSQSWVIQRKERRAGAAIEVLLALQARVSDYCDSALPANSLGADLEKAFVASHVTESTPNPLEVLDEPVTIPVPDPAPSEE